MMIVTAWLAYCALIAAVLTAGAAAWESAARWSGRPARWGWVAALAGTATLPWLLRLVPEGAWVEALPEAAAVLRLDPLLLDTAVSTGSWSAQRIGLTVWLAMSIAVLCVAGLLVYRLVHARREWRVAEMDGSQVLVADDIGPALVGVRRPMVVVPAWVLELDAELRGLLLHHERAHAAAGDQRMLFAGLVLVAAMPWNPIVWFQLLRMRNAIELDCDARVLAAGADPERYGSLLLEVGRRRGAHTLVMTTFAEPRMFLEQRIRRIAQWPPERSHGRAALFALSALLLFATALSARDPLRARQSADDTATAVTAEIPASAALLAAIDTPPRDPTFTPMTVRPELLNRADVGSALERNYPPLLRDAGIDGRADVWFYLDSLGVVQRTLIGETSGYPALDSAALAVARVMRFSPAYNREKRTAVWVEIPIVFTLPSRDDADSSSSRPSDPPAPDGPA